ncbi:MAG: exo-beta-N-acetylmuramidase NamZ domain-containing protein [Desulfobacteraceae bacterium]
MAGIAVGLDLVGEKGDELGLKESRIGLLCNQASVDSRVRPAPMVISKAFPGRLKALFSPQHGLGGEDQDNMVETDHSYHHTYEVPIFSLYADERAPRPWMLEQIDVLIVDLQDVGTRVYTFASTLLECLKAVSRAGKRILVLDRPNPLGGKVVEGNLLLPDFYSFVGPYRLPMRHGLTMAEMAVVFNRAFNLEAELDVILMRGWGRWMEWEDTGLRWVMPSPNMPSVETARVYPGQVIWEGTNVSEGRGTCRPFELFGAPFLDPAGLVDKLPPRAVNGCLLQEFSFRPTFHKWEGQMCKGLFIHVLDRWEFRPYTTTLALLGAVIKEHGGRFEWRDPPYEYVYDRLPVDVILGDDKIRTALEAGADPLEISDACTKDLQDFLEQREPDLLYPPER